MKKRLVILLVFILGLPFCLLSAEDPKKEVCLKFLEGYMEKNAQNMIEALTLPSEFFKEVIRYEAKKGGVSEEKIKNDISQFLNTEKELLQDCVLGYLPISGYAELKDTPSENLQRIFYINKLNDEERFYFQDRLTCRKYLFITPTSSYTNRYLYMEVCQVKEIPQPWIDRLAIFSRPELENPEFASCFMEKIGKILEKAKPVE
jgi:hypothetical protein